MSGVFLGVDGGGTKTALCLVTQEGEVAATTRAPSIYYFRSGISLVTEVLTPAVAEICSEAGIVPADLSFAFFGMPGYGEASGDLAALDAVPAGVLGHDRYACDNDMVCGWAGSLGAVDGINVISGTGSMTYGERGASKARVGGWGEVFGDEGSAYWIAVRGLAAYSRMVDGRFSEGPLLEVLRSRLDLGTDLDLIDVVLNRWGGRRGEVAEVAPLIVEAASRGDEACAQILREAGHELALLVEVTRTRLGYSPEESVPVSWSGGVFSAEPVATAFRTELAATGSRCDLREPLLPPHLGAALYAARLAGSPIAPDAVERLRHLDHSSTVTPAHH